MTVDRTGLEIGPFDLFGLTLNPTFHWYGLIIVTGIFLAALVVALLAKRDGKDPDHVWNALVWIVLLGVVGARLWHVLFPAQSSVAAGRTAEWYLTHPFDLHDGPLIIWNGGLGIFGAVIGGALGVFIYGRRHKLDIMSWIDIAAISLPLGQAIGRWGNFVNQELYGKPTDLPWGISLDHPPTGYTTSDTFHPLFLYESLWNLINFGILLLVWFRFRERLKQGDVLLLYLVLYPIARFALEFLRFEPTMVGAVNVSRVFAIGVALVAAGLLAYRHRNDLRRTPANHEQGKSSAA
jgi:phosphatidylglycerol---prolipoprotein diacylglyceryl transferase